MSRWMLMLICLLAFTAGVSAQEDELDALLAGLGDEPAATAAEATAPAAADAVPAAEPAAEDPFADLVNATADVPAAEAVVRRTRHPCARRRVRGRGGQLP